MITVVIVLCPKLLLSGLRQSIYNLTILLRLKDILNTPSISSKDSRIGLNITQCLILDIIKRIYIDSVNSIFRDSNRYPNILSIYYFNIS